MSDRSAIEWCDASWNPLRAKHGETGRVGHYCEKVSLGCVKCYAEMWNLRGRGGAGTKEPYTPASLSKLDLFVDGETLSQPLRWRRARRIFVCSMTDLFGKFYPDHWIDEVFAVALLSPQHIFQILTKREDRMFSYMTTPGRLSEVMEAASALAFDEMSEGSELPITARERVDSPEDMEIEVASPGWPLPNVWLGVSAERQEELDARWPVLRNTPAELRFLSLEPLLGEIDVGAAVWPMCISSKEEHDREHDAGMWCEERVVDWVIVGGESGPGARPLLREWVSPIVDECRHASVALFVKQMGSNWVEADPDGNPGLIRWKTEHSKGGDPAEWPPDLRVREFPEVRR